MSHGRWVKGRAYCSCLEQEERGAGKPQTTQAELQIQEHFWMKQIIACSYTIT